MGIKTKILFIISIFVFGGIVLTFCFKGKIYAATCGNGVCEPGENCSNCSIDCGSCPTCGNGVCEQGENCSNCSIDCSPTCGNGICESSCGENSFNCFIDCGPTCGNGVCESGENPSNCCIDCYQKHYQKGCYDKDVYWYDCFGQRNDKYQECGDSGWLDEYQCSGNWVQRKWIERGCQNSQCFENQEWRNYKNCENEGKICQDGECINLPSVDLKVNRLDGPIAVAYKSFIGLSWSSENTVFCEASGDWSGLKPILGTEVIQLNSVKTYNFILNCYSSSGKIASDSVEIRVLPIPPKVETKPIVKTQ